MDAAVNPLQAGRKRTLVMGVLNVTPDSFSDGGRFLDPQAALRRALEMAAQGADLVDLGGESTRPGAPAVSLQEELDRVLPVARALASGAPDLKWSIDTQKAQVARQALALGAAGVNDVSALRADPAMAAVVAAAGVPVVLMHRLGNPQGSVWSTQEKAGYGEEGVVAAVARFLKQQAAVARAAGIEEKNIWVDPGLGFGKSVRDNLRLLREGATLAALGYPLLVGASRKSMLGAVLGGAPVEGRLEASLAAAALACWQGAACVRTHDVAETVKVVRTVEAIKHSNTAEEGHGDSH